MCHEKCPFFFIITSFPDLKKVQIRNIISAKHCCVPSEILYSEHNRGENRQVAEQSSALSGASPSGCSGLGRGLLPGQVSFIQVVSLLSAISAESSAAAEFGSSFPGQSQCRSAGQSSSQAAKRKWVMTRLDGGLQGDSGSRSLLSDNVLTWPFLCLDSGL